MQRVVFCILVVTRTGTSLYVDVGGGGNVDDTAMMFRVDDASLPAVTGLAVVFGRGGEESGPGPGVVIAAGVGETVVRGGVSRVGPAVKNALDFSIVVRVETTVGCGGPGVNLGCDVTGVGSGPDVTELAFQVVARIDGIVPGGRVVLSAVVVVDAGVVDVTGKKEYLFINN